MAKTKKTAPQPRTGSTTATKDQTGVTKPAPATPGGPNRLARKEEARRQREVLRKKMARRKYYRWTALAVAVLVLAAAGTAFAIYQTGATSRALKSAGCGPVRTIGTYQNNPTLDRAHIGTGPPAPATPPPLSSYASVPPTSGPHKPPGQTLHAGVYTTPPDVYMALHSLEHGAVIVWYSPSASQSDVSKIVDFYRGASSSEQDHVIVAEYNYPEQGAAGQLPAGKQMVLVAWHHMETCTQPSPKVVEDFVSHYRIPTGSTSIPPGYKGDAPEVGSPI